MTNIVLTTDQKKATNAFLDFLVNDEAFFVINGAAGTGKSFLIKYLLETFYSKYSAYCLLLQKEVKQFNIHITATTNKAVTVIADFLEDSHMADNIDICTIYSLLGLKITNNFKTGKQELTYNKNSVSSIMTYYDNVIPLVFIDEASFIGEDLQAIIETTVKENKNIKIVYIGDKYQLAPVGQSFSAMDSIKCDKVSLTKVMRNAGHILKTGTQFRETVETGKFQPIHYNHTDITHVDGPTFQNLIDTSFSDKKWDSSKSKILAWTNERVQEYNQHVRTVMNKPKLFTVGEFAITNEFIKGTSGTFTRGVDSEVFITNINSIKIDNYGVLGYMVELNHSYVGFMPENFQDAKALMKELAAEKEWKKFFEIKENWLDLRAVYASSIHKSQGSTYDTVFLDLSDIGTNWNANDVARLLYVGITRAAKKVVCYGYLPDRYC